MITETIAALNAVKQSVDLAKGALAAKTAHDIKEAVADIQEKLFAARDAALNDQQARIDLIAKVSELEAEIAKADEWKAIASRYRLHRSEAGSYTMFAEATETEPAHHACQKCFDRKERTILQAFHGSPTANFTLRCHTCGVNVVMVNRPERINMLSGRGSWG